MTDGPAHRLRSDILWDLDQGYSIGARAIAAHAVDEYQKRHSEMRRG